MAAEYVGQVPDIRIAGIIGPRGDAYSLNRTITAEEAEDYHAVQLETLRRAEVDLAEGNDLQQHPRSRGRRPCRASDRFTSGNLFTLDSTHRLKSGPSLREAIEAVDAETNNAPAFYGINCSHPVEFEPALEPGSWLQRVRCLRPNAAKMDKISLCKLGHLEEGDPVELGLLMGDLARRYPHIDIWGGCCGTGAIHLDEIARNVLAVKAEMLTGEEKSKVAF
jgi:S-methylmethionine-dependent homocysteine/selenocysteine methylase